VMYWADENTVGSLPAEVRTIPDIAHCFPSKAANGSIIQHNIVLNARYYGDATVIELLGDVAHELSHEAYKAIGADNPRFVPSFGDSPLALASNEWKTDILTIYKGFGSWLLASREYLQRRVGQMAFTDRYAAMKPIEIQRLLRSELEEEGRNLVHELARVIGGGSPGDLSGRLSRSSRVWSYVTESDPGYAIGHYWLGVVEGWLGRWNDALGSARAAFSLEPANPRFAAYVQEIVGKHRHLLDPALSEATGLMKRASEGWITDEQKARGDFTKAAACWREILERIPFYAFAQHELGVALEWLGEREEAIEHLQRATKYDPQAEFYSRSLGNTLTRRGDHARAAMAYADAVDREPQHAENRYLYALSLMRIGNRDLAEKLLARAIQLDPANKAYREQMKELS
ncbi:MAG: tetratricopeptide repeat protein, partial [Dehalococcoidia bacterium]